MEIQPLSDVIAVEILGIDVSTDINDAIFDRYPAIMAEASRSYFSRPIAIQKRVGPFQRSIWEPRRSAK